jgi:hypothetical protein
MDAMRVWLRTFTDGAFRNFSGQMDILHRGAFAQVQTLEKKVETMEVQQTAQNARLTSMENTRTAAAPAHFVLPAPASLAYLPSPSRLASPSSMARLPVPYQGASSAPPSEKGAQ